MINNELIRRGFSTEVNQHCLKVRASSDGPMLGSVGCHGLKSKVPARFVATMCKTVGIDYEDFADSVGLKYPA